MIKGQIKIQPKLKSTMHFFALRLVRYEVVQKYLIQHKPKMTLMALI